MSKKNWKQICSAQHHTIGLSEDGKVYAIGRKEYGRLGLGKDCADAAELMEVTSLKDKNCVYIGCGSSTSFAVTDKGMYIHTYMKWFVIINDVDSQVNYMDGEWEIRASWVLAMKTTVSSLR